MNTEFWSIIAQVSATFVGLVFVGQVFYISNIKDAVEMQIIESYGFVEISTSAMILCISTNLILFLYPLLVSLCLITTQSTTNFVFWEIFWLVILTALLYFVTYIYSKTRAQFHIKGINSSTSNLIMSRLKWGQHLIYFGILLVVGLLIQFKLLAITVSEQFLQFTVIGLSCIGLGLSAFDLVAFDKKNILFRKSSLTGNVLEGTVQNIQAKRGVILSLFTDYSIGTKSAKYTAWQKLRIQEYLENSCNTLQEL